MHILDVRMLVPGARLLELDDTVNYKERKSTHETKYHEQEICTLFRVALDERDPSLSELNIPDMQLAR